MWTHLIWFSNASVLACTWARRRASRWLSSSLIRASSSSSSSSAAFCSCAFRRLREKERSAAESDHRGLSCIQDPCHSASLQTTLSIRDQSTCHPCWFLTDLNSSSLVKGSKCQAVWSQGSLPPTGYAPRQGIHSGKSQPP